MWLREIGLILPVVGCGDSAGLLNQRARSGLLGRLRGGACWRCGWWAAGQVVKTAVHKASQARARGQWLGRGRIGGRGGGGSRAGEGAEGACGGATCGQGV